MEKSVSFRTYLTQWSVNHPWLTIGIALIITLLLAFQFPKVHFDNDPENMLNEDEPVRVFHNKVKKLFDLYDFVIAGVVNEKDPDGIFNPDTLKRIHILTYQLMNVHKTAEGRLAVRTLDPDTGSVKEEVVDLIPKSKWLRFLNFIFRHNPENLIDPETGESVIIAREIISPSVVDNIKQAELGSLKIEYLMEQIPRTREEARRIRDDALNNPLYRDTLVSPDGKVLCLYIPLTAKHYSYNVTRLIEKLTENWPKEEKIFFTGLPVAEDTFGVEMLIQMATSAPLAGLVVFLLLLLFFRKVQLILAPMIIAVMSILCAMGLLIGLGYDVHIMSSMIAIFLMPISVCDSVHMLSEFYDTYQKFRDKKATILHIVDHLFMPMLYTSLTTIAGFASLATTPIPPVKVFGLHVAFGVAVAWILTVTFVPAYIVLFIPQQSLDQFGTIKDQHQEHPSSSLLMSGLGKIGIFALRQAKWIVGTAILILVVSIIGITKIQINDNPIKWFTKNHRIRVADEILNQHFGGTYTAYLILQPEKPFEPTCFEKIELFRRSIREKLGAQHPEATQFLLEKLDLLEKHYKNIRSCNETKCFAELLAFADSWDNQQSGGWNRLIDVLYYLDTEGLNYSRLKEQINSQSDIPEKVKEEFLAKLESAQTFEGEKLVQYAIKLTEKYSQISLREFLIHLKAEIDAPTFKRPEMLQYVKQLQNYLLTHPMVGKTTSAVDAVEKAHYELNYRDDHSPEENKKYYSIPTTASGIAQVYIQLTGMKKKDSLFHLVTRDYNTFNIWIQLKSGDNKDMESVLQATHEYIKKHPSPIPLSVDWAGLTYINVAWQKKMVYGMLSSLGSSAIVVFVMMLVLFRSPLYGLLSMIPLSITIAFIYGFIGWIGKDYDMPVAVLSSLTLGLSVDFAIHFLERARESVRQYGSWTRALPFMFAEPAAAITRNAIVIAVGFLPLLTAPLVPYKTVGFFLASIMTISAIITLILLPALLTLLQKYAFPKTNSQESR